MFGYLQHFILHGGNHRDRFLRVDERSTFSDKQKMSVIVQYRLAVQAKCAMGGLDVWQKVLERAAGDADGGYQYSWTGIKKWH